MNPKILLIPLVLFVPCITLSGGTFESLHERLLEERRLLVEERQAIREAYGDGELEARSAALTRWRDENRERLDAVREMAGELSRESAERLYKPEAVAARIAQLESIEIPDDLPAEEITYLEERRNWQIERLNKMREVAELPLSERREAMRQWREDESEWIGELRGQAELASGKRRERIPDLPDLPDDLSSEERTFITLRHELYRERLVIEGEYADASQEELRAALDQWRYERSEDFDYVRSLAEEIAQ